MKKNMFRICLWFGIFYSVTTFWAAAADAPIGDVKTTIESILNVLRDADLAAPAKKTERRNKIQALIAKRFNFKEMAQRVLGRHWRKRTPEEKNEFVSLFAEFLQDTYVARIEKYTNEKITYGSPVILEGGRYGLLKTIVLSKEVEIPVDYRCILKEGKWWVYDVVIEGISLVSNYRTQYNKIIMKESYAKLVEKMKQKLAE